MRNVNSEGNWHCRLGWSGIVLVCSLLLVLGSAFGQSLGSRKNVKIEVQYKSAGYVRSGELYQTSRESNETQMLLVMDGLEGRLFIGKEVPYALWYRDYLRKEGYLTGEIKFRNVGTSLIVRPRVRGNQIEVTLTPEVSYETQDGSGSIAVTSLSTTVLVPNGQSIEIGAGLQKSEFEHTFYTRETGEAVRIVLVPTILET
ncbi:MAG: hypothetical protein HY584_06655 [Candidatus Omnitrophica bacterium]|nr:hypothetical protein [Candidatus Omnitrophota bacterium]